MSYFLSEPSILGCVCRKPSDSVTQRAISCRDAEKLNRNERVNILPSVVTTNSFAVAGNAASRPHFRVESIAVCLSFPLNGGFSFVTVQAQTKLTATARMKDVVSDVLEVLRFMILRLVKHDFIFQPRFRYPGNVSTETPTRIDRDLPRRPWHLLKRSSCLASTRRTRRIHC